MNGRIKKIAPAKKIRENRKTSNLSAIFPRKMAFEPKKWFKIMKGKEAGAFYERNIIQ